MGLILFSDGEYDTNSWQGKSLWKVAKQYHIGNRLAISKQYCIVGK